MASSPQAGSLACSGLTSYSAIKRIPNLGAASRVVVISAGGLGIMGIGASRIVFGVSPIAVDVDDAKLDAARAAGAGHVLERPRPTC